MTRRLAWCAGAALVVLAARVLAYALSPAPLAVELGRQAGGPRLVAVAVASLAVAVALSAAIVWLAALGVAERRALERRPVADGPRLRGGRVVLRSLLLFAVSAPAFALLESYLHWRAGLGWHGLHCLLGPVHRDALPLLGGLSLVAAALGSALEHVVGWMRRTLASLETRPRAAGASSAVLGPRAVAFVAGAAATPLGARGPPLVA